MHAVLGRARQKHVARRIQREVYAKSSVISLT